MLRVHVICEGQTEEMFVKDLLVPYFMSRDTALIPALLGKPGHKGGNVRFERIATDIRNRLNGDPSAWCTTFFDFYGLPGNFPGKSEASGQSAIADKARCVCDALTQKLSEDIGPEPVGRFIPYVQMYEFEALLFSDCERFARGIYEAGLSDRLGAIRRSFPTPEDINDSPTTAPSKRVLKLIPGYEKPLFGTLAAHEIGLETMRRECRLFDGWIHRLESLQDRTG